MGPRDLQNLQFYYFMIKADQVYCVDFFLLNGVIHHGVVEFVISGEFTLLRLSAGFIHHLPLLDWQNKEVGRVNLGLNRRWDLQLTFWPCHSQNYAGTGDYNSYFMGDKYKIGGKW